MGEHIDKEEFRIVDLTIQEQFGSIMFFVRLVEDIVKPLRGFLNGQDITIENLIISRMAFTSWRFHSSQARRTFSQCWKL